VPNVLTTDNRRQIETYFSDTPLGANLRNRVDQIFKLSATELGSQDMDIGVRYEAGAILSDGTPAPMRDPSGVVYEPSTRPGGRLPHVWLKAGNETLSTHVSVVKTFGTTRGVGLRSAGLVWV